MMLFAVAAAAMEAAVPVLSVPIRSWASLESSFSAAAGTTASLTLAPEFTMDGYGGHEIETLTDSTVVTIEGNGATFDAGGKGGFFQVGSAYGALIMSNITMKHGSGTIGGAIYVYGGSVTLSDCTFDSNTATGAITVNVVGGAATLSNCTFVNNVAATNGGALYFGYGSISLIKGCSFIGPISDKHNDVYRKDTAEVTFACADGQSGSPVRMQGNEIAVIPPKDLHCEPGGENVPWSS
jgi:predicted outer membrane repeat protein